MHGNGRISHEDIRHFHRVGHFRVDAILFNDIHCFRLVTAVADEMTANTGNKGFFLLSTIETLVGLGKVGIDQLPATDQAACFFLWFSNGMAIPANLVILSITSLKFLKPGHGIPGFLHSVSIRWNRQAPF